MQVALDEDDLPLDDSRTVIVTVKDTVQVLIPGGRLQPGIYTLELRGVAAGSSGEASGGPIASFQFSLEYSR